MKQIESIIDDMLHHKISKKEAIEKIESIVDFYKNPKHTSFEVESVAFTSQSHHGILKLILHYRYDDILHISRHDKIDVIIPPKL